MSGPQRTPLLERFWKRVVKHESGCWLYGGERFGNKYAQISFGGREARYTLAHRFSYEIHHGEIGRGKFVCHKCDVRNCVNPDHLYSGDHEDNNQDRVDRGRSKGKSERIRVLPYAREGERAFNRALTSKAQALLKSQYESGKWTQAQLAKAWRVSQGTVSAIVRGVKNMGAGGDGKKRTGFFNHKVTQEQRDEIAMRYLAGGVTQKALAEEFGLDQTYISVLIKRFSERNL